MKETKYHNNKINVASIAIEFRGSIEDHTLQTIKNKIFNDYPIIDEVKTFDLSFAHDDSKGIVTYNGYKLTDEKMKYSVTIVGKQITFHQLGTYTSFADFTSKFVVVENICSEFLPKKLVTRIDFRKSNEFIFPTDKDFTNNLKYVSKLDKGDFMYSKKTSANTHLRRKIDDKIYNLLIRQSEVATRDVNLTISGHLLINNEKFSDLGSIKNRLLEVNENINHIFKDSTTAHLKQQLK